MQNVKKIITSLQKGQFFSIGTFTPTEEMDKKLLKKNNPLRGRVTRETYYDDVRFVDYENMEIIKEKRENGVEATKPSYDWVEFPYIAKYKTRPNKLYAVVRTTKNVNIKSRYFVDGVEVKKEDILPYMYKTGKVGEPIQFSLDLEQIIYIKQGIIRYKKEIAK